MEIATIIDEISNNETYNTTKQIVKKFLPTKLGKKISLTKGVYKNMVLVLADFEENCNFEKFGETVFEGNEITLYKANLNMLAYGHLPCAMIKKMEDEFFILVNSAWENAPKHVKKAILAHELGHLHSGHLNNLAETITLNVFRMFGSKKSTVREIEADAFAVDAGHKEGMLDLFQIMEDAGFENKEMITRRKAVETREEPKVAIWEKFQDSAREWINHSSQTITEKIAARRLQIAVRKAIR